MSGGGKRSVKILEPHWSMKVTLKLFAFCRRELSSYSGEGMTYLTNMIPNLVDQNAIFKYVFNMLSNTLRLTSHLNDHSVGKGVRSF